MDKAADPKAIYDMHAYWSKKHWSAIREYIRHYLPKKYYPDGKGLILDPYCGSGMTGVASLMEGKPSIQIDASPAAAFIAHHYLHPVDPESLQEAYDNMMCEEYEAELKVKLKKIASREINNLGEELDWLYETKCDRCGGKATTEYVVYSQTFMCPNCGEIVALYDCPKALVSGKDGKAKEKTVCPTCYKQNKQHARPEYVISTRTKTYGEKPVLVSYLCQGVCKAKRNYRRYDDEIKKKSGYFNEYDLAKIELLEKTKIPHWFPDRKMMDLDDPTKPWGMEWRPGRNFRTVSELYTRRNFWALSAIAERTNRSSEFKFNLLIPLTAGSLILSRMCREATTQTQSGTYYIPQISKALHVGFTYESKLEIAKKAQAEIVLFNSKDVGLASAENNTKINNWPKDSVDYIFTDPPYADKVQYGELNFIWEAWINADGQWRMNETVIKSDKVDPERLYTPSQWGTRILDAFHACYKVLKPGRWMSVCYHDSAEGTWRRVQDILLDIGFEIHSVTVLDPLQKSMNQITAEKVVKSDLVLNCRKPKEGDFIKVHGKADPSKTIHDRVRTILEETLGEHPGLTRDKLFDIVARRLLERAQFVEHRFEDILSEVATKAEGDRWYLKAELEQLSQDDLKNEEKAGLLLISFTRLRCAGVPAKYAAVIATEHPRFCEPNMRGRLDEEAIEKWINDNLFIEDKNLLAKKKQKKLELGGRLSGIEFYDALFFYMTRYMKNKKAGQLPKRNLAEFLEEYLVRFKDADKWLYKAPSGSEAEEMRKARRSGLGRRIRAFANALKENDRQFTDVHKPDIRT
ncbi:MAG: hypothetical protein WCJ37_12435, partial [Syntrophus sp. (in: bacteria)]